MKNFFFVLLFVIYCFGDSLAQITLDGTIPSPNSSQSYMSIVRFGLAGDLFVLQDQQNKKIDLYDMSQVLLKSFPIPSFITSNPPYSINFISDNLFDTDSSIEYLVLTSYPNPPYHDAFVLKEDSSILLEVDSVPYLGSGNYGISTFTSIYPTSAGTKLILLQKTLGYEIFSLPGSFPCYECSNGVFTGNFSSADQNKNDNGLSNPFPNPTSNLTRIDYQLPNGISQGELVFYNTMGNEMKRFKVTSTFNFIYVSAKDLPSGTYYYHLQTSAGTSEGKKMVVIR